MLQEHRQSQSGESATSLDVRSDLPYAEFVRQYQSPRLPVILSDAIADWDALKKWTPDYLKQTIGDRNVPFRGLAEDQCTFHELTDRILNSTPTCPSTYMQNVDVERDLPELYADIRPRIRYAVPDWKSSRLMPKDWLYTNNIEAFFYGGGGTRLAGLHYDYYGVDAFISQVYGDKEFLIFSPEDTQYLYPKEEDPVNSCIDNPMQPDLERFPLFREAHPIRFILRPGQTLYVPNGWWHTTRMPSISMTVITIQWNSANWNRFVSEVYRLARQQRLRRDLCMVPYMKLVGSLLKMRQALFSGMRQKPDDQAV